jgi:iron complex outermembrane receptor protein
MSHRKCKRERRTARAALMTAVSLDVLALGMQAHAQQSAGGEESSALEEVVVTSFRASLEDALQKKRASNQIIETITAEDIGKFPDQNVAESLQRLSGIQIDRVNGQGTTVRIRGLDQNVTLLNEDIFLTGLEVFTRGEGNDRFTNSLEGIPSELLGGLDVFKSPTAAQLEGGLGGIVNLRTRSALEFDGTTLAGNVRFADTSGARESWDPLATVLFGHNFSDRWAVLATVSYDKNSANTDALGGQNRGNWRFSNRGDRIAVPTNYFAPEYRYTTDREEERERIGGSLAVAFRPNDAMQLDAQWFHSDNDILTQEASLKFPFAIESPGLDVSQPFDIDDNGVLLNGALVANSAEAISFVRNTEVSSDNFQVSFNFDNDGPVTFRLAAAYSTAEMESNSANNDVRYTQYSVPTADPASPTGFSHRPANPAAPANYRFTYDNGDGVLPAFGLLGNPDLFTNPANGFFKSHWAFGDQADLDNWAVRADAGFGVPFVTVAGARFTAGARLAERNIDYTFGRYLADYSGRGELDGTDFGQNWTAFGYFQDGAIGFKSCELPPGTPGVPAACNNRFGNSPPLITPFQNFNGTAPRVETIGNFWGNGQVAGNAILVQDREAMENAAAWIQALYPNTPFQFFTQPVETFQVQEETTSAYLMSDFGETDARWHFNAGLRFIRTDLTIDQNLPLPSNRFFGTDSWNGVLADFETTVTDRSYTDTLPSANFVYNLTEGSKLRISAAKVVARQNLFDLGRGFQTDFTRNPTTNLFEFTNGSAGNPNLDPFRAGQFDVGYEYYFGRQGLLSATVFYKDVESFVANETRPEFVNDQGGGRLGPVTRPVNGEGGEIKGFELGAQMAFDWGGGFNVNYTYSDSESPTFNDFDSNLPIPGVAENAFNITVYYERNKLQSRLSYAWVDESFDSNFGFGDRVFTGPGDTTGTPISRTLGVWNRDYGQLDGQVGYQVTKNILVTLEALNITEEDASEYLQFENLPFTFSSGSRRILLGVRGNFGGR